MTMQATSSTGIASLHAEAFWRSDIDALIFPIEAHGAVCAVHRRAFRTLLKTEPTPEQCLHYFAGLEAAFRAAAYGKIAQKAVPVGQNIHLTSRDVARKLVEMKQKGNGER